MSAPAAAAARGAAPVARTAFLDIGEAAHARTRGRCQELKIWADVMENLPAYP